MKIGWLFISVLLSTSLTVGCDCLVGSSWCEDEEVVTCFAADNVEGEDNGSGEDGFSIIGALMEGIFDRKTYTRTTMDCKEKNGTCKETEDDIGHSHAKCVDDRYSDEW